jgi:hypothetical protein
VILNKCCGVKILTNKVTNKPTVPADLTQSAKKNNKFKCIYKGTDEIFQRKNFSFIYLLNIRLIRQELYSRQQQQQSGKGNNILMLKVKYTLFKSTSGVPILLSTAAL